MNPLQLPLAPPDVDLSEYTPPTFDCFEDERLHRKRRLAAAFRLFAKLGFDEGAAGHITARDPEHTDCFWVNPFAMHFSHVRVSDLVMVNHAGEVVIGSRPVNRAAFAIHSEIHAARPDTIAAAHAHSVHGKAFSALAKPLAPLTQDACAFYEDHAVLEDYTGIVIETDEGKKIATTLGDTKAIILRNHGLLTVGGSVDEAAWWFITLDRSCQAQLLAEAAATPPVEIDDEMARLTAGQVGTPVGGWISFKPLHDWIVREQPDLLD